MTIRSIEELATIRDTTVNGLKHDIHEYTDYDTVIDWSTTGITLTTSVPEAEATETKSLSFPFTEDDFDDAIIGLQCWADFKYCEANQREV